MGKPLEPAIIEYAYVVNVSIEPNSKMYGSDVYLHYIRITYELKDADKNTLATREKLHKKTTETMLDVAGILSLTVDMGPLVAEDKLELSGYAAP